MVQMPQNLRFEREDGMVMTESIVIIGGGQAGAQAIDTLRREGYAGSLCLVGDEPALPYQRPPLSKKFLSGDLTLDRMLLRHRAFYDEHRVELKLGVRAVGLDAARKRIALSDGTELAYDRLLLCLGGAARRLDCPGAGLGGVHHLRGLADAEALREDLSRGGRAVIIGGGYIGLETAATCRALGREATVLEMTDRLMNRVVAPAVSEFFADEHRAKGVAVVCGTRVVALEGTTRVREVVCADGSRHAADLVIVGIGGIANTGLALAAGLACDHGIVVDSHCRTSDPSIFAAGDCTNHPSPHYGGRMRLESVDNAFEQAKAAALNLLDRGVTYDRIPWFWSDQFAHKLLIVGLSRGHDRVLLRGDPATGSFSVCYLRGRELLALEAVNQAKDYMAARRLIAERVPLDVDRLADPRIALKEAA
jgi:3-phenylpropionate/trans-cinnamate dioxygenase ferredoxin reductase subunit